MFSFKGFITTEKNTHLEHLEDDIINRGSEGGKNAVNFLKSVRNMLAGSSSGRVNMSVKWDGAPAIICGINPENGKFFVGTKAVFNKTPKVNYTNADIRKNHSGELATKLSIALKELSKLGISGVLQGDFLFSKSDLKSANIDGDSMITFTPNTITYAIPLDTDLGKRVHDANLGIVFHTTYSGDSLAEMSASFGCDVSPYQGHKDVAVFSSDFNDASGSANFSSPELVKFKSTVNQAEGSLRQASKFLDVMKGTDKFAFNTVFKQFFNTYIRGGRSIPSTNKVVSDFAVYYTAILDKEINSKKSDKGKQKWTDVKMNGLKFIAANQRSIYMTVASYKNLTAAKLMIIRKLESVKGIGTFLKDGNGYKVTAPEGFVAIKSGTATKLVDRLEFSVANFTTDKNWDTK